MSAALAKLCDIALVKLKLGLIRIELCYRLVAHGDYFRHGKCDGAFKLHKKRHELAAHSLIEVVSRVLVGFTHCIIRKTFYAYACLVVKAQVFIKRVGALRKPALI